MEFTEHLEHLEVDGALLAKAAAAAGWHAPVPATEWDVRTLVTHVGGVHRWAAAVVGAAATSGDLPEGKAVGTGPDDEHLLEWFIDGHATLVETLRAAPPDLECFAFLPAESPRAFWGRRQAHETAVHRADVEAAAGTVTPFDPAFAQDGIGELLHGFAARRNNAFPSPAVLALQASDGPGWRVRLGGERTLAEQGVSAGGDATVTGTSSDLYLWLWNRPCTVAVSGDASLAALWRERVRVRWG